MASVRVEDEARKDPRIVILGKRLKTTKFDALARMIEIWAYCTEKQTYFLSGGVIDACAEFEGFAEIICEPEIGLAEFTEKGIRIKGTKGRIEWLTKLRKQSKKGGQTTRAKWQAKRLAKEGPNAEPKEGPLSLALAPVLAPVPVLALSKNKEEEEELNLGTGKKPEPPAVTKRIWEAYSAAYRNRHGAEPLRNARVNSQLKQFSQCVPLAEAPAIAEFYLSHSDAFYVKQRHPVGLLLKDAEKLRTEWITNSRMTGAMARQAEAADYHQDQLARVMRGDL